MSKLNHNEDSLMECVDVSALVDDEYLLCASSLSKLYSTYNAVDVIVSLNVSDLWLPNISSQIKHCLAFGVFSSMAYGEFYEGNRIDTYDKFSVFVADLYSILPGLPMLEDYIPEADWGDVCVESKGHRLKMYCGGSVENLPDFIEAFNIEYGQIPGSIDDMHSILSIHDFIISRVDKLLVGDVSNIATGNIEVPSKEFYVATRGALLSLSKSSVALKVGPCFVVKVGEFEILGGMSEFVNSAMTGTSLPAVMVDVDGGIFPLSMRNSVSFVIDFWVRRYGDELYDSDVSGSVSDFFVKRFDGVVTGPLELATHKRKLPYLFALAVKSNGKVYLVMHVNKDDVDDLLVADDEISNLLEEGTTWGLINTESRQGIQLSDSEGRQPSVRDVCVVAYLSGGSTSGIVSVPKSNIQVMSLPDFVSVFDSLVDIDELSDFFDYVESTDSVMMPMSGGLANKFSLFRNSHSVLVEGANEPDMIMVDPHMGSNWRFDELAKYWASAPDFFPDRKTHWMVKSTYSGITCLYSKGRHSVSWCTSISGCTLHFVFDMKSQGGMDSLNGRLLELFVECMADAVSQRRDIIGELPIFSEKCIVVNCQYDSSVCATEIHDENTDGKLSKPILGGFESLERDGPVTNFKAKVNLARVRFGIDAVKDASFQAECSVCLADLLMGFYGADPRDDVISKLNSTSSRQPRVVLTHTERMVDVPDICVAEKIKPEHYKLARKSLAHSFKLNDVLPGRYELDEAKTIIDIGRNDFRVVIHSMISSYDKESLLLTAIKQHGVISNKYRQSIIRYNQSLNHEVVYDVHDALSEAKKEFSKTSKNYRYLIECCISSKESGVEVASLSKVAELIGFVDWLLVLYSASDTLHNDIEVGGIEISEDFVPEVFYSEGREVKEKEFSLEVSSMSLGVGVSPEDEVSSGCIDGELDQLFLEELGISYLNIKQVLAVLARWPSFLGSGDLSYSYKSSRSKIIEVCVDSIPDLVSDNTRRALEFLIINPRRIRCLLGRDTEESDVPVWDHTKRGDRYTIKPLVCVGDGDVVWESGAANQALRIWGSSIENGYLPADYDWLRIKPAVRDIKERLEKGLEKKAFDVCSRSTPYLREGIDFKRKFPSKRFPDVGDFDVLAYWPESNTWLAVECKYNQPPFCLKDARRLRERIFGGGSRKSQISKIEKRSTFLNDNLEVIRELMGWPIPKALTDPVVVDLYVSREIYWWMRNPPVELSIEFVRVDLLDSWMNKFEF